MKRTEIKPEFLGVSAMSSFVANSSSPRSVMAFSHKTQMLPLRTPEEPTIKSGMEYELGEYINDVRVENDCVVKAIIPKYREYGVERPPVYTLLVEFEEDGVIYLDYIDVDTYRSSHTFFGYELEPTEDLLNISYNSVLTKGTVLSKTKSLGEEGAYNYGINANVAFMTHPSVAEDGFAVSRSFVEKTKFTSIVKRVININKDTIPLNVHGDKDVFKFIPDIGDEVDIDGMLCALRPRNDWFSISDLNTENLSTPDATFDVPTYVAPKAKVIDVSVIRGNYHKQEFPSAMTKQLDDYAEMLLNYYRSVITKQERILLEKKQLHGESDLVQMTPRLIRFISDMTIELQLATNGKNKLCFRKLPIDQYRVEVTTMVVITPDDGNKLTDTYASKGTICAVIPDEEMPVDKNGNRVDVITDSISTTGRMTYGRAYHGYLGAFSRDNRHRLIAYFKGKYGENFIQMVNDDDLGYFRNYIRGMYSFINTESVEFIDSLNREELLAFFIKSMTERIEIFFPTDNEYNIADVILNIDASEFKPHIGKLSFIDDTGKVTESVDDIRVCELYFIVLEKTAHDYSGVSSAKINNFGFPVKGGGSDRFKYPHSLTPVTTSGETETRIGLSHADPSFIAESYDLTLNPISHKLLVKNILDSDKAFDTTFDIDRTEVPYGNTKPLSILRHIATAYGFNYVYVPEEK